MVVVVLALAGGRGAAFAHAEPAEVSPGDGAVLTAAPSQVVITMSQEMFSREGANDIDVLDSTGKEVTSVAAVLDRSDRTKLTVALPSSLQPGLYTVKWKSLSAEDADGEEGTLTFTFDPNGTANPGVTDLRGDIPTTPLDNDDPGEGPGSSVSAVRSETGVTWVLVAAVGIGSFVLGAGGTFLLVQRKP